MRLLKQRILVAVAVISLSFAGGALLLPQVASADAKTEVCNGIGAGGGGCTNNGASIDTIVKNGIQLFAIFIGIVAVVMVMVGAFKIITAGGDSSNIASGRATIMYAIVGLVVAAFAQILVSFVLAKTK